MKEQLTSLTLKATCLNLRHKMMYVDERQNTPGLVDDSSGTRVFFCTCTHDSLGPDHEPCSPQDCQASRRCYCSGE